MWQLTPHGNAATLGAFSKMSGIDCRFFYHSPHHLPLLLIFPLHPTLFRFLRVSFWKRLLRTFYNVDRAKALSVILCTENVTYGNPFYKIMYILLAVLWLGHIAGLASTFIMRYFVALYLNAPYVHGARPSQFLYMEVQPISHFAGQDYKYLAIDKVWGWKLK